MPCDPRHPSRGPTLARAPEQLGACRDAPLAEGRARINTQAASTGRNRCSSAARGSAPTTRSISCPSRITTSNGIDCAPNLVASLDSRQRLPSLPSGVPRDSWPGPRARARSSDTARTTPPRNRPLRARTRSSRPRTWRCPRRRPKAEQLCTAGSAGLRGGSERTERLRALQLGQPMIVADHQVRARRSSGRLDPPSSASTAVWTHPRRDAKNTGQPVDRAHHYVSLDALGHAHERDTGLRARPACPSSPAP